MTLHRLSGRAGHPPGRESNCIRLALEPLEAIICPSLIVSDLKVSQAETDEGGQAVVVTGKYSAASSVGALQIRIDYRDGSSPTVIPITQYGTDIPFTSPPHVFLDNKPGGGPRDVMNIEVRLVDTGPQRINTQGVGKVYRAYDLPYINMDLSVATKVSKTTTGEIVVTNRLGRGVKTLIAGDFDEDSVGLGLGGNTFTFYGTRFGSLNVSENGLITLAGTPITSGNNATSLTSQNNRTLIAPYWDNLVADSRLGSGVVYRFADLDGVNGPDYLIIEWDKMVHGSIPDSVIAGAANKALALGGNPAPINALTINFQAMLQLNTPPGVNGEVIFNYTDTSFDDPNDNVLGNPDLDFGNSATFGLHGRKNVATPGTDQIGTSGAQSKFFFGNRQLVRFSSQNKIDELEFSPDVPDRTGYQSFRGLFESRLNLAFLNNVILSVNDADDPPPATGKFGQVSAFNLLNTEDIDDPFGEFRNTFTFYNQVYDVIFPGENGLIVMSGGSKQGDPRNGDLSSYPQTAAIAPLWDQWGSIVGATGDLVVRAKLIDLDGDDEDEFAVVEWSEVRNLNYATPEDRKNHSTATFQAILELNTGAGANGAIYFNYVDTDVTLPGVPPVTKFNNGASATVGIKDAGDQGPRRMLIRENGRNNEPLLASGKAIMILSLAGPSSSVSITVNNTPPSTKLAAIEFEVDEGDLFSTSFTIFDESGNPSSPGRDVASGTGDSFPYSVDWGDACEPFIGEVPPGPRTKNVEHVYLDNGTFTATLRLRDDDFAEAPPRTFNIRVNNRPPEIRFRASDQLIRPGERLVLSPAVQFIDRGLADSFIVTIDWGDGSPVTQIPLGAQLTEPICDPRLIPEPLLRSVNAAHPYVTPGERKVKVTVTDDDGGADFYEFIVSVGSVSLSLATAGAGGEPRVTGTNTLLNRPAFDLLAYAPSFRGGVRAAAADLDGDTLADVVTVPGPTGGPHVRVFGGATFDVISEFFAFTPLFTGGAFVAVGNVLGDGAPEIIVAAGPGGGPNVRVFDLSGNLRADFFAYDPAFPGGVSVAVGDVTGNGYDEIITGAGPGGGPHVRIFSGDGSVVIAEFFPYDPRFLGGVNVAAGNLRDDGDGPGRAEVIVGPGVGGGPHVRIFDGLTARPIEDIFPFPPFDLPSGIAGKNFVWVHGVRVGTSERRDRNDLTFRGFSDLVTSPGPGVVGRVRKFLGTDLQSLGETTPFDPAFLGGVYVGGNNG